MSNSGNPTKREPLENVVHNILDWYVGNRAKPRPYQIDWEAAVLAEFLIAVKDLNRPVFDQALEILRLSKYPGGPQNVTTQPNLASTVDRTVTEAT